LEPVIPTPMVHGCAPSSLAGYKVSSVTVSYAR
jgi:hypothetical protein